MKDLKKSLGVSVNPNFVEPPAKILCKLKVRLQTNICDIPEGTIIELNRTELHIPSDGIMFTFLISQTNEGSVLNRMIRESAERGPFHNPLITILTTPIKIWVFSQKSINDYILYI